MADYNGANDNRCHIVRLLTEEFPEVSEEWFVFYCRTHRMEISEEWAERRNGPSEPVPIPRCPGAKQQKVARSA